jgi:nicotinamide/nicotinate riboside kinase
MKPDKEIPIDEDSGLANWDCAESLDFPAFVNTMQYIRAHKGQFPPGLESKEDQNELGESGVSDEIVKMMAEEMANNPLMKRKDEDIVLCLVDGFLLYLREDAIRELDIRLLIRAPYEKLKARREARTGYVTLDGMPLPLPLFLNQVLMGRILAGSAWIFR